VSTVQDSCLKGLQLRWRHSVVSLLEILLVFYAFLILTSCFSLACICLSHSFQFYTLYIICSHLFCWLEYLFNHSDCLFVYQHSFSFPFLTISLLSFSLRPFSMTTFIAMLRPFVRGFCALPRRPWDYCRIIRHNTKASHRHQFIFSIVFLSIINFSALSFHCLQYASISSLSYSPL